MRTKIEAPKVCPMCSALMERHTTCGNPMCDWVVCGNTKCAVIIDTFGRVSKPVPSQS